MVIRHRPSLWWIPGWLTDLLRLPNDQRKAARQSAEALRQAKQIRRQAHQLADMTDDIVTRMSRTLKRLP